jgi:hypothetical protein
MHPASEGSPKKMMAIFGKADRYRELNLENDALPKVIRFPDSSVGCSDQRAAF